MLLQYLSNLICFHQNFCFLTIYMHLTFVLFCLFCFCRFSIDQPKPKSPLPLPLSPKLPTLTLPKHSGGCSVPTFYSPTVFYHFHLFSSLGLGRTFNFFFTGLSATFLKLTSSSSSSSKKRIYGSDVTEATST